MPDAGEEALAATALAGDERALGELLAAHQRVAYNVAYRLLGDAADARDAVQDAFLRTVRAVRGEGAAPREAGRFGAWLRQVVTNAALERLRRRPAVRPVALDALADALPAPEADEPAREAERRETRGDVLRALLALPDGQRAALTLREYHGLSSAEIGAALGVGPGAADMLLFRARREFRAAYEGLAAAPATVSCPALAPRLTALVDDALARPRGRRRAPTSGAARGAGRSWRGSAGPAAWPG